MFDVSELPEDVRLEVEAAIRSKDEKAQTLWEEHICEMTDAEISARLKEGFTSRDAKLSAIRIAAHVEKIPEYEIIDILTRRRPELFEKAKHA